MSSTTQPAPPAVAAPAMSHREILEALSGLLLGMFVTILASTVVSNALPRIISDLHAGESAYTWVVTATLLALTVTTPIWGKLADLTSKKMLIQIALTIFVLGSALAGLSQNAGMLITFRVVQGVGAGGLTALVQVILAAMISPRERGRYMGYLGAVFAVGTVLGPLVGGVIVDTSWLGWRWCFYVGIPFAAVALVLLQRTLHLPVVKRQVTIDYLGATLVAAAVSLLLIWVSLAGHQFGWNSLASYVMVPGAILLGLLFLVVEQRAAEPIIPLRLFRDRTVTLSTVASLFVGIGLFGGTVFLAQYFQISRGHSPTASGLMSLPLVLGLLGASTIVGQLISRSGVWKRYLVTGGVLISVGFGLMGSMRTDTPYWLLAFYMLLLGSGLGMMMQNLVLATQNVVATRDLGAASSTVAFFRSLGGAVGVSALGALLAHRVASYTADGLAAVGVVPAGGGAGAELPNPATLPEPVRQVVQDAFGHGIGDVFLFATPFAVLAFVAVLFVKETVLQTKSAIERDAETAVPTTV
ncbi:MAG TPA: MDR family MFS transporter [Mycobacteriales bacterium]|jgi:EmrB/QacA subfamily drug resistance transporter|nr:MDR family MFS transporter [Mycobacteriales bacterium]